MALDVYVGTLTRFYTGNWRPIVAQLVDGPHPDCGTIGRVVERVVDFQTRTSDGKAQNIEVKVNQDQIRPASVARERIESWRREVNGTLETRLTHPIEWVEADDGEYFTDKPGWGPYGALLLWAAHEEHPEFGWPTEVPKDLGTDPAFAASSEESMSSRYPTLLRGDFWLPGAHSFTVNCQSPVGAEITLGFTEALFEDLRRLNSRTWRASEWKLARWFREAAREGDPLELSAKSAFSILFFLAKEAVDQDLPMVLDW